MTPPETHVADLVKLWDTILQETTPTRVIAGIGIVVLIGVYRYFVRNESR